jgi:hypothetical protein
MVTDRLRWLRGDGARWALLSTLAGMFVLTCLRSLLPAEIVVSPGDTAWFFAAAKLPANDMSFWMSSRPWGYPLLLKICGLDQEAIATCQFALHIASHIALAFALFVSGSVLCIVGAIRQEPPWLYSAALVLGSAALFRTTAWAFHGAALATASIVAESVMMGMLIASGVMMRSRRTS